MPNWCVGTLRVRGKSKDLQNFVLKGLKPVDFLGNECSELELDEFAYVSCDNTCWIEGTRRGFVNDLYVSFKDYEDDSIFTIALDVKFAWEISADDLLEICKKYNIDMKIYGFEQGMEFNQMIEIIDGKILKDAELHFKIINGIVYVQIWEDKEPMSIKKILDNCEAIDDEKKDTELNEMTNAEFIEKIKQECENNEELRKEVSEITGIFLRAIIKYLNSENCEVIEDDL